MTKLSSNQLVQVTQYIRQTKSHPALQAELVDHMATLLERQMNQGQDFPTAFGQLTQQTNAQVMLQLTQSYDRQCRGGHHYPGRRRLRLNRRPATTPFRYIFLTSGLAGLLLLGGLLVVTFRPLAIPIEVFHFTWAWGLMGLGSVGVIRWALRRKVLNSTLLLNR